MNHKQFWILVSRYYKTEISDVTISMYAKDVETIEVEKLNILFEMYRKNPKNRFMPLPSDFLSMNTPYMSIETKAEKVSILIQEAISKFGWPNKEDAKKHIGEVGWKIVEMRGGWTAVCENLGSEWDVGTFHAQVRQSAKSIMEANLLGLDNSPIDFLEKEDKKQLESLLKQIEHKRGLN